MRYRYTLLAFVVTLALSDPFSAYGFKPSEQKLKPGRKYTTIERLQTDRLRYQKYSRNVSLQTGYKDFRGVLHAHAEDSTHTGGTRSELLAAAKRTGVRIVMLTNH